MDWTVVMAGGVEGIVMEWFRCFYQVALPIVQQLKHSLAENLQRI